eukprot:gnl/TRDRNA2_/TRDRNA2_163033_c0_seq2.p1 gnl/TRDRNA2_/TRDRNA2_163033_c0~~gnl/TRDRNA2_/TRDRNA2_163033_c0_seq2.p1  ORF type:complete len:1030 (-),score=171.79 gnl/TRDRNA2_/TRDRNA2_163033_c0_seq2:62-3151(-)
MLDDDTSKMGHSIMHCLSTKGFCVMNTGMNAELIESALADIASMESAGRLRMPPALVQAGLFGSVGSSSVAELSEDPALDGKGIQQVDQKLADLFQQISPHQEQYGICCTTRSVGMVHQTDGAGFEPDLTDKDAQKWCSIFLRAKVIATCFLGPGHGTLELKPLYDEDADTLEITTGPGMWVLIRTDGLDFSHTGAGGNSCVSSFFLQNDIPKLHINQRVMHYTPVYRDLQAWIDQRIFQIYNAEALGEESVDLASLPREFVLEMHHHYRKNQELGVTSVACKFPTTWDVDSFFRSMCPGGTDHITEVPMSRWNHEKWYDSAEDSWTRYKTNCKHGAFTDGVDLFDCRFFGLSPQEAKSMDPMQRYVLETSYDALYRSGMTRKKLMNSLTSFYIGASGGDWNYTEKPPDTGIYAATGASPAIMCGRMSFCLGCKGTSVTIDLEGASSLATVYMAAESLQKKGNPQVHNLGCAVGVSLNLAGHWWPAQTAAGMLCAEGRSFVFDDSARGFVKGEGCGAACIKKLKTVVDGQEIEEDQPNGGIIVGGQMSSNGRVGSLTAPNGPAMQQIIADAIRAANILPNDIDAMESSASGSVISDAVEVASVIKAARGTCPDEPLFISSGKSMYGNPVESAGIFALFKSLSSMMWGLSAPGIHLRQLNPHLDISDSAGVISSEPTAFRMPTCFHAMIANGHGGANVSIVAFGEVDEVYKRSSPMPPEEVIEEVNDVEADDDEDDPVLKLIGKPKSGPKFKKKPIVLYWPAGAGDPSRPRDGYFISGTWNDYVPESMEETADGLWEYKLIMGVGNWEQFQISTDATGDVVLHPPCYKAGKGALVFGPEEATRQFTWLIDARPQIYTGVFGSGDEGAPGDEYTIQLHISGKWRTVTWLKGCSSTRKALLESSTTNSKAPSKPSKTPTTAARYYLSADWSHGEFEEMEADQTEPGLYTKTVKLVYGGGIFQICRNKDLAQAFYPLSQSGAADAPVYGPDDSHPEYAWYIDGKENSVWKISFKWTLESGVEQKKVSWTRQVD